MGSSGKAGFQLRSDTSIQFDLGLGDRFDTYPPSCPIRRPLKKDRDHGLEHYGVPDRCYCIVVDPPLVHDRRPISRWSLDVFNGRSG
jgi:hypothetical protein